MGILTLKQDGNYVITSDRSMSDAAVKRAPKANLSGNYHVWTGDSWSLVKPDAMTFQLLDEADEYVKSHYSRLTGG